MRYSLPTYITLLMPLAIAACNAPGTQEANAPSDTMGGAMAAAAPANPASIDSVRDAYQRAANAGDMDALVNLFADDAVIVTPDGIHSGRGDIRDVLSDTTMAPSNLQINKGNGPNISGDMAWETGTYSQDVMVNGRKTTVNGSYLVVLKRQADGSWKLVADADVPQMSPPAARAPTN